MSGSAHDGMMVPMTLSAGEARGAALQEKLEATSVDAMRDIAGDRILAAANMTAGNAVVIDGEQIIGTASETFGSGKNNQAPIMIGFTRDERFANLGPAKTLAEYEDVVRTTFPAYAKEILKAYPAKDEASVQHALTDLMRDMSVGRQMFAWAGSNTAPAFGYFFTRRQPYVPGITFSDHDPATVGAYHTGEVPYFLRTLDSLNLFRKTRDWTAEDRALSERMSDAILSFARTGNPGWTAFDTKQPEVMRFDIGGGMAAWPNAKTLHLLDNARTASPRAPVPGKIRD
jgi:para-nitrobenzyl esterase